MKKLIMVLLAAAIVLCGAAAAFAADAPGLVIGNEPVQFTESTGFPFVDEANRTLVPLRVALETFGCEVEWDAANQCAVVSQNAVTVTVPLQQKYIIINGMKAEIDTQAVAKNGRIYLPLRAVLEAFGGEVSWDAATNCITVSGSAVLPYENILSEQQIFENSDKACFVIVTFTHDSSLAVYKYGSGFFLTADGIAAVNAHVIKDSAKAEIYLDGKGWHWVDSVLYMDEASDIALIRVSQQPAGILEYSEPVLFDCLPLTDQIDRLHKYETLYAADGTRTLLYSLNNHLSGNTYLLEVSDMFSENEWTSGMPLLNAAGEVVAMTSAALAENGRSLAVKSTDIALAMNSMNEQPYGVPNGAAGSLSLALDAAYYDIAVGETVNIPVSCSASDGAEIDFFTLSLTGNSEQAQAIYVEPGKCLIPVSGLKKGLNFMHIFGPATPDVIIMPVLIGGYDLEYEEYADYPGVPDFGSIFLMAEHSAPEVQTEHLKIYSNISELYVYDGADIDNIAGLHEYYSSLLQSCGCICVEAGYADECNYSVHITPDMAYAMAVLAQLDEDIMMIIFTPLEEEI